MKTYVKVLLVVLLVFCTIIPNNEIWNLATQGYTDCFHVLFSCLDFILEGALIYYISKHILFKKEPKPEDKKEE